MITLNVPAQMDLILDSSRLFGILLEGTLRGTLMSFMPMGSFQGVAIGPLYLSLQKWTFPRTWVNIGLSPLWVACIKYCPSCFQIE